MMTDRTAKVSAEKKPLYALIKVGGGEPLHVEVVDYELGSSGTIYIFTKDRMYVTSVVNVLLVRDLD